MNASPHQPAESRRLAQCPVCNYSLHGLPPTHRCPECGFEYDEGTTVWRLPVFNALNIGWGLAVFFASLLFPLVLLGSGFSSSRLPELILGCWSVVYVPTILLWYFWYTRRRSFIAVGRTGFAVRLRGSTVRVIPWERVRSMRDSAWARDQIEIVAVTGETVGTEAEVTETIRIPSLLQAADRSWLHYGALHRAWQKQAAQSNGR